MTQPSIVSQNSKKVKVALVCDWLTTVGGAESVLLNLHQMYPNAPIYTSKYDKKGIDWFDDADVRTGFLQYFPRCLRRFLGPLRQFYFSHLDLSDYDLVISVTGAEAKAVKTRRGARASVAGAGRSGSDSGVTGKNRTSPAKSEQTEHRCVHLCYCHVPTQYYWGMYDDYLKNPGFGVLNPLVRLALKIFVRPLRKKDFAAAQRPDQFITISNYAADLIKKYYKREATVIYPPADLAKFSTKSKKFSTMTKHEKGKSQAKNRTYYITTSRQVNWKCLDICVMACKKTGAELTLIGDGPEHKKLVQLAGGAPNIHFLPTMPQEKLRAYFEKSDAFLFPSLEPFGLAPIEAMAAGLPVLAYDQGGARDYIQPGINGLFFNRQTASSLISAMEKFENSTFDPNVVKNTTVKFDKSVFREKIQKLVEEKL